MSASSQNAPLLSRGKYETRVNSLVPPESRALPGRRPGGNWRPKFHNLGAGGPPTTAPRNVLAARFGGLLLHSPPGCTGVHSEVINKADVHMKASFQLLLQNFISRPRLLKGEIPCSISQEDDPTKALYGWSRKQKAQPWTHNRMTTVATNIWGAFTTNPAPGSESAF